MSIFTRKKKNRANAQAPTGGFTRQQLFDRVAQMENQPYFMWAVRMGGRQAANRLITAFAAKYGGPGYQLDGIVQSLNNTLMRDDQKFTTNMQTLRRYRQRAVTRGYSRSLADRRNHMKEEAYQQAYLLEDLPRAVNWVLKSSMTINKEPVHGQTWSTLSQMMGRIIQDPGRSLFSMGTLNDLNASAGQKMQTDRLSSSLETFYGTSYMGEMMLPRVLRMGREWATPQLLTGTPAAVDDLASFLMLGVILAHGFGDGNGRTARALYACTLLRHGRPFIPPAYAWVRNQTDERQVDTPVQNVAPPLPRPFNTTPPRTQTSRAGQPASNANTNAHMWEMALPN